MAKIQVYYQYYITYDLWFWAASPPPSLILSLALYCFTGLFTHVFFIGINTIRMFICVFHYELQYCNIIFLFRYVVREACGSMRIRIIITREKFKKPSAYTHKGPKFSGQSLFIGRLNLIFLVIICNWSYTWETFCALCFLIFKISNILKMINCQNTPGRQDNYKFSCNDCTFTSFSRRYRSQHLLKLIYSWKMQSYFCENYYCPAV